MELRDLLTTIKHRLNLASIYGIKAQQVGLLVQAIDRFGFGDGCVLDDSELLPAVKPVVAAAEEPVSAPVDIPPPSPTDEQVSALDELVAEAERLGMYETPAAESQESAESQPEPVEVSSSPVVSEVEKIEESSDTTVAEPAAEPVATAETVEAVAEVTPDNQSEAQG